MTFKTILVYCDSDEAIACRLDVASRLAENFGSHLIGLHVRPPFQTPVFYDASYVMDDLYKIYEDRTKADQVAAFTAFAKATEGRNVVVERRVVDGWVDKEVARRARYADLVVVGQRHESTPSATPSDLVEAVALSAGRAILVVPHVGSPKSIGKNVLLCWNASRESARAAADALPLMKSARKVTVLAFREKDSDDETGVESMVAWLGHHGIKAMAAEEPAADVDVADLILSRATDLDADLIVMGVYGHTRVREMVLGGVSRTLLRTMTVPLFMSH
jgi:nucleotide-binding universal stress UspA family protein